MQTLNTLIQKYSFVGLLLCVLLTGTLKSQNRTKSIDVNLKIVDDSRNPISTANVEVGEGVMYAQTGENGTLSFKAFPKDFITVSSNGYEKRVLLVESILIDNIITLKKSKLFMTSDDAVPMPFLTLKKRYITGSNNVVLGKQLEKYPSTDIRNTITGLVAGLNISERNGSPGLNSEEKFGLLKVAVSARGRNLMYIIDDVPTDVTQMQLDPNEIESITVIKDIVAKAMYGPAAADGIIFIKTKRGKTNERILNMNIEDGISLVGRMPEFVSGADYAQLNNQARTNSGLIPPLYSEKDISEYAKNNPFDMYHPNINFKDMMLKNTMTFRRANVSSRGGNNVVQYFAYLGYSGEGGIYKLGNNANYNRINARSNIDINVNNFIKIRLDFFGGLTLRRSPNYISGEQTDKFNSVINDINSIPPIAFPVFANNDPTLTNPWYAVSSIYKFNPIGNLIDKGYYNETGRTGASNVAIDYDMSSIVKGLKSRTYLGFNVFNLIRIGKALDYSAYIVNTSLSATGADTLSLSKVHDGVDLSELSNLHDYSSQVFGAYENLNYEKSFGKSFIQSSLTYFISKISQDGIKESQREQNGIFSGLYSYNDKYNIQGVLNYAGTYSFDKGKKYQFFPSIGASWVISEENFMSEMKSINYLKLRAEAGILGYESYLPPFYYNDNYTNNKSGSAFGPYSISQWFGSSTDNSVYRTSPNRIGNPNITWEKRKEFSIGLDALMLSQKLSLEVNYYNNIRDGVISQVSQTIPYLAGISNALPYFNYNKIRYYGIEIGVQYVNNSREFKYSIGGNATIQNSRYEKYDEPNYRYSYQSMIGKPVDSYYGLTYVGKFNTDEETMNVPQIYDDKLYAGDLKYKDMNADGFVDDNDNSMIGHTEPRLYYALNAKFSFKNFALTVIGAGSAFYDIALTNQYYWNGWGNDNYSKFVKDNIGGSYPRLTYNKVENNFKNSKYWLTKGGFFKIQNVELAYTLPQKAAYMISARGVRFFARGANLLTVSKIKDVDPESINSGIDSYPLFKTFTVGINLNF